MVLSIDSESDFDRLVISSQGYVLVDFHAEWCGPCKRIAPYVNKLSQEWSQVQFYKVDVDEVREAADEQEVQAMPTFILYKDGKEVSRTSGASEANILKLVSQSKE